MINVNPEEIARIATHLNTLNQQLSENLQESKTTIDALANYWEGDAAQSTISAFDEFATKYFQDYENVIKSYIEFLNVHVSDGYIKTESVNTSLADSFK